MNERNDLSNRSREFEEAQQKQHFESWQTFWGRPGNGASRETVQKGNLMKMLHYPEKVILINESSKRKFNKINLLGTKQC